MRAQQKNALVPVAAGAEGYIETTPRKYNLTPRQIRLARALLSNPAGLPREAADRATPASNSPEYIRQLRERLGLDIPCEMVAFVTIDGVESKRGVYHLTYSDRQRLVAALD